MSAAKTIQNPEIPGMERILPPPPPPPPPPEEGPVLNPVECSTAITNIQPMLNPMQNIVHNPAPAPAPIPMGAPIAYPAPPAATPYYPVISAQPPPQTNTPWWVSTDVDTNEAYQNWYKARYEAALAAQNETVPKTKNKGFKRKPEVVDPKLDAEKVANAQRELSALMKPLKCDLCNAVMNSTLQAKVHYQGKPHQKKVSMFLNQSAKKVKAEDGPVSSTTGNDWNTYCEICKTWFTSQIDAAQHYAGKKHMKAAHGVNKGRPNKKSQSSSVPVDPTGRFGIGVSFQQESSLTPNLVVPAVEVPPPPPPPPPPPVPVPQTYGAALRCDLCGISTNRLDQLEIHKRGARHLRMLKLNGMSLPESSIEKESIQIGSGPIDYSIYRTPSGQYYCAPCNLSLNSESMFAQHIESKKHKNQTNPKVQSGAASAALKKVTMKKK